MVSSARMTVPSDHANRHEGASASVNAATDPATVSLSGRLDRTAVEAIWTTTLRDLRRRAPRDLVIDLTAVSGCDTAGATLLAAIERTATGQVTLRGGTAPITRLLEQARTMTAPTVVPAGPKPTLHDLIQAVRGASLGGIAYLGEAVVALTRLPANRRMFRPSELALHAEHAGLRSLPLVILLGYLMGLILAFQSSIPMRRFGAEVFVANLVSISLLRELGPLLAAVILSGRTASAFAAEIGTMKVNEELDALTTMGLDPMTMLVLPRILAAIMVTPVMTLVLDVAGLAGMATVMQTLGYPVVTVVRQVQAAATAGDLAGGLFKAVSFGAAIAAIGCRAGLATGVGPRAVGLAATAAVVGGIISTILLDGVFAVLFFRLGL